MKELSKIPERVSVIGVPISVVNLDTAIDFVSEFKLNLSWQSENVSAHLWVINAFNFI